MRKPDDILEMSDAERRRLRLQKKFRHYKKQERIRLSRDDLLEYLRERKIRSCVVLEKLRKPTEPNTNDFRREFGSWTEAVQLALGSEIAVDVDGDYILKSVWQLNLWSVERFREARKLDPVTIPSWRQVKKGWGSYSNLFECAKRHNLKRLINEYLKLIRKLGHIPSLEEIKEANIRMDDAIDFYGGKKKLDEFILSIKGKL